MRLNKIENGSVSASLSASELVSLSNIIYEYQKTHELKASEHELYAQIMTARDLSQYGHIDGFTLRHIVLEKLAASPDGEMGRLVSQLTGQNNGSVPDACPEKGVT